MKKTLFFVLLVLSLVLAACRPGEPAPTETPTAEPSPTAEAVTETPAPTDTPALLPTVQAPPVDQAGVLNPNDFTLNVGTLYQGWGKNVVQGAPYDPNTPPPLNGFPPSLLVNFGVPGDPLPLADEFDISIPQGRVFPTAAYRSMYQAAANPEVDTNLQALQTLLEQRPVTIESPIPVLPGVSGEQVLKSQVNYTDFTGGSGVGFIAAYSMEEAPLSDQNLFYFFLGLSDDGQHYLAFVQPLSATFLPDDPTQIPQETLDAYTADANAYYQSVVDSLNTAPDDQFTPNLNELRNMYGSIQIGAPAAPGVSSPITGAEWQWIRLDGAETIQVNDPTRYTLLFLTDGTFQIRADCNRGSGTYSVSGSDLQITVGPLTRAICPEDSLELEFLDYLGQVVSYNLTGGQLFLNLGGGGGTMVFSTGLTAPTTRTATATIPAAQGTPTPTSTGTAAPGEPVIINFNAEPRQFQLGTCTTIRWDFAPEDVERAQIFRETVQIGNNLADSGSLQDCPPTTGRFQYFIEIETEDGREATRSLVVTVNPPGEGTPVGGPTATPTATQPIAPPPTPTNTSPAPPTINSFSADNTTISVGQCVNLSWSFSGQDLALALLSRNGEVLVQDVPMVGSHQDCPTSAGDYVYTLSVSSEFAGTVSADVTVTVQ